MPEKGAEIVGSDESKKYMNPLPLSIPSAMEYPKAADGGLINRRDIEPMLGVDPKSFKDCDG